MKSEIRHFGGNLRHIGDKLDEKQRRRRENWRRFAQITQMFFQFFSFCYVLLYFMVHASRYIFKSIVKVAHNWNFKSRSGNALSPSRKSTRKRSASSTVALGTSYNHQGLWERLTCYWWHLISGTVAWLANTPSLITMCVRMSSGGRKDDM